MIYSCRLPLAIIAWSGRCLWLLGWKWRAIAAMAEGERSAYVHPEASRGEAMESGGDTFGLYAATGTLPSEGTKLHSVETAHTSQGREFGTLMEGDLMKQPSSQSGRHLFHIEGHWHCTWEVLSIANSWHFLGSNFAFVGAAVSPGYHHSNPI